MAAPAAPNLPSRFPCWCRATYSWGGESKRDLGFVEGDLIECLNAGDGSWWMGRLRRDKRAVGLFPSNFVKVLDENFQPVSRISSPMPPSSPSGSLSKSPQKAKTFRKPFQSYAETGPLKSTTNSLNQSNSIKPSPSPSRQSSHLLSSSKTPSRQPSHEKSLSRQPSYLATPANPTRQASYLQTSVRPSRQSSHDRQPSTIHPSTVHNHNSASRSQSPAPPQPFRSPLPSVVPNEDIEDDADSPPPPSPPPHRVAYSAPQHRTTPSPSPSMNNRYPTVSRGPSPGPVSPGPHGHTPSPLRDAMDDVMSSLQDMALRRNEQTPSPQQDRPSLDPWSSEAFEELQSNTGTRERYRPRSSLGIASSQREQEHYFDDGRHEHRAQGEDLPQVHDYVERMEEHLKIMESTSPRSPDELFLPDNTMGPPPAPPPKNSPYQSRPQSSMGMTDSVSGSIRSNQRLKNRKSAYELGRSMLDRTFTTRTSGTSSSSGIQSVATNSSSNTSKTSQSIMSGHSAGGFSATSAGSLARKKWGSLSRSRPLSVVDTRHSALLGLSDKESATRPQTSSQNSNAQALPNRNGAVDDTAISTDTGGALGGLRTPKSRKSGFFKKLMDSAKTGTASVRSTIAAGQSEASRSPIKNILPNGVTAIAGGSAARDMGPGGKNEVDWVQVRRDVNRSNSLSRNERMERIERCQMMDYPVIAAVDDLRETAEGDEGLDGMPIDQTTDFLAVNFQLVDKSARFVNSLPPMTNPTSLAQGYICRPYRSDVQRLRAIFTWVSEKIAWEEDFEGELDLRRVIQMRRGGSEEVALLVFEMCSAIGLHAEVVRGYLKSPGEVLEQSSNPRPNHWWNVVIVDNSWRFMDCSLARPTNPKRGQYSSAGTQVAENGFFLARPTEICYTHIASNYEQQHICPPIDPTILLALPCACPPYFQHNLQMVGYDTSLVRIENLELVHVQFTAPPDIECVAEVEARSYTRDADGDVFESGDTTVTRALAQAEWVDGQKRYTVKALLPADEGHGILKVYAGKRGLMHSIKDNPHPLAFALPIVHTGNNPPYRFLLRHPTPHALRHDLYVAQPQCHRLAINNTFVFAVRQHPSSLSSLSPQPRSNSPLPLARPSSALSMVSTATSSNDYFSQAGSDSSSNTQQLEKQEKPAKLAIQTPSGKILRLMKKHENSMSAAESADGGMWETIIKIGERGTWRGLVLADRSARWCVFAEWECF